MVSAKNNTTTNTRPDGNVTDAHAQWATRPADQRFWNLDEMARKAKLDHAGAIEATVKANSLRFESDAREVVIVGEKGIPARMTHYAFGQACTAVGAPAGYLRKLPATIAARCLSHSYEGNDDERTRKLLLRRDGRDYVMQGSTGDGYARVWNKEIVDGLMRLRDRGWAVPPARPAPIADQRVRPATEDDVRAFEKVSAGGGQRVKLGDSIAPAGLYMSDHDVWAFMIDPNRPIDNGGGGQMFPFFCAQQSEVGASSIWGMRGYLNGVCGNHIIWGARELIETRIIHRGEASDRWTAMVDVLCDMYGESTFNDQQQIVAAQAMRLGADADEIADKMLAKRLLTKQDTHAAIELCIQHPEDGAKDPLTVWGMVQGITRLAQQTPFADERGAYDRTAGRVLQMAF